MHIRDIAGLLIAVVVMCAPLRALAYSELDDDGIGGLSVGVGTVAGSSDIAFVLDVTQMSNFVVWQVYGGGVAEASLYGASADWILAGGPRHLRNLNRGWLGAGVSGIIYSKMFTDDTPGGAQKGGGAGVNLGAGWRSGRWGLDGYMNFFPAKNITAFQFTLLYDVN